MAAYAAVVSLQHTINGILLDSSYASSREILELAYKEASPLQEVLEGLNGSGRSRSSMERVDVLEGEIRDCAHKLEDVLEFLELKLEEREDGDEVVMRQEIRSFGEAAKRMDKEYLAEVSRDEGDDDADEDTTTGSSEIDFGVEMIGRSGLFNNTLRDHVLYRMRPDDRYVFVFIGEDGSCARLPVKAVFDNWREAGEFERCGWARLRGCDLKHVLMTLIGQIEPDHVDLDEELLLHLSIDRLRECLYEELENRSYMIVLDGVDDKELLDYLCTTSFPDQSNGSAILVNTSSRELLKSADFWFDYELDAEVYEEDLWFGMRFTLFGRDSIPPEVDITGKQIVRNCRYLPISIAKTTLFLSKSNNVVEQLSKLAADEEHPIFIVEDEVSESDEILKEVEYHETWLAEYTRTRINRYSSVDTVNLHMYPERFFSKLKIISFFGMVGIGKTAFVRNIFQNDKTLSHFDHHVWIPIGPRYQKEDILIDILAQICPHIPKLHMHDEKLAGDLCAQLSNRRCLIVFDDLCSQEGFSGVINANN